MRFLATALLCISALAIATATPQGNGTRPLGDKNETAGSLRQAPPGGPKHMRHGSWGGSGSDGKKPKHHCRFPPKNGSFDGSFDHDGSWEDDGSRNDSRRPRRRPDGSRDRPDFDCDSSNSSDDDVESTSAPVPSTTSGAAKQIVLVGSSVVMATVYLLV